MSLEDQVLELLSAENAKPAAIGENGNAPKNGKPKTNDINTTVQNSVFYRKRQ